MMLGHARIKIFDNGKYDRSVRSAERNLNSLYSFINNKSYPWLLKNNMTQNTVKNAMK